MTFWFGLPGEPIYGKPRACWFRKKLKFDQEVRDRFLDVYHKAVLGQLDIWYASSQSCLALILLFDQFPRNMFRGTAQAFATGSQAITAAERAITMGFDHELITVQRWFIYLPFEHSENLAHQRRSVELFSNLSENSDPTTTIDVAIRHLAMEAY